MVKRQCLQRVVLEKLNSYVKKNEITTLPNIMHKINLKWTRDLNVGKIL